MTRISQDQLILIQQLFNQGMALPKIAITTGVRYTTVYYYTRLKQRGFASGTAYHRYLACQNGHKSLAIYRNTLAQNNGHNSYHQYNLDLLARQGFRTPREYLEYRARVNGFASFQDYKRHVANRPINKLLSSTLKSRLKELHMSYSQLAKQLEVQKNTITEWANGRKLPRQVLQPRLFGALGLRFKSLDELIANHLTESQ